MLIEASSDSEWVARCLEALGHKVIVADPNFAPVREHRALTVAAIDGGAAIWVPPPPNRDGADPCEQLT